MEKSRKMFISVVLLIAAVEICFAQHWSYGLQPGGKRNAENLVESFQEIENQMEKLEEMQKTECPGPYQHSRFSDLKGALASLIEGQASRKKI
ncbi:progonadoliberin-1 [Apteryx mantelli]|uniref:Progonadoliberin-1 n=2 Tax=Apteryx TaxID=8821 RepID=A0A8B9Q4V8_APTOW|nr:PREDICTED: progonadoliberin-1 [Apteryx mantelli mantelli]XP_025937556.1 progonadoliberin-1 [Apteryx rowi]